MGLATVELVMDIEDEFDIRIPDKEASNVITVGDLTKTVVKLSKARISAGRCCPKAHAFYLLRRTLGDEFGVNRSIVRLDSKIGDLVPNGTGRRKWPRIAKAAGIRPPNRCISHLLAPRFPEADTTVRELLEHHTRFYASRGADRIDPDAVFQQIRKMVAECAGVPESKVHRRTRFIGDLHLD